jgi:2'-5' RNA ligase
MPDVELARRPGVELIRTGRFQTLTGSWNPTPADIQAAVDAMNCPAIRKPVIRLGHSDQRFVGDGEPALGWFENLRAADDGHTLIADQVTLPWLHSVQAAAYPSRSIEGNYNHRCSEGHVHPFVIHTVALLGVTPPGVQTLRSLNDLPDMLGVAASGEVPEGAEHVQVTVLAADAVSADDDPVHTGAMVALIPTAEDAARLAIEGGEPADELHVTLAYLGEAADLGAQGQQDVIDAVSSAINGMPTVEADIFSVNVFNPASDTAAPDARARDTCLVWGLSGDEIDAVHDMVNAALVGLGSGEQHRPWHAHMTAQYTDDLSLIPVLAERVGPVNFDRVRLAFADTVIDIPLIDVVDDVDPTEFSDELEVPNILMPVAAASADKLRAYWVHGEGAAKIRWGEKNDFYRCVKQLRKYVTDPKGLCNTYHREALGVAPGQEGVHASADPASTPAEPALELPAAEPEHKIPSEPKEDHVSDLSAFRSRLGLDETADEQAILSALDALKTKADTPAEPSPEMVAASAAAVEQAKAAEAEKDELRKEVQILASQMKTVSDELAATKAEKAATVKASVFEAAIKDGKIKPADRETWEKDYDEAPAAVTRVLASIAVGTAVPVKAGGTIGDPEPNVDDDFEALIARIDAPTGKAA